MPAETARETFFAYADDRFGGGMHITFGNGYTVSVAFGARNYGDGTGTAEALVWNERKQDVIVPDFHADPYGVMGWQSPEEIARLYATVAAADRGAFPLAQGV